MSVARLTESRKKQLACILGMAMTWPSLHNQFLYPVTFSFHKDGADAPFGYYLIYSLAILAVTLVLAYGNRDKVAHRLIGSPRAVAGCALISVAGLAMLIACDFGHDLAQWLMGLGSVLAAVFVPVSFTFWSSRILYASERRAGFDLVASYGLFCIITMTRLALDLHAWPFAIAYPLVSAALVLYVGKDGPGNRYALRRTALSALSMRFILPSVGFVYVATVLRCLMSPINAAYDYPPVLRVLIYVLLGALCVLFALLYRPHSQTRRNANLPAFVLTAELLAVGLLLAVLGIGGATGLGNLSVVAGINALELLIWVFVLVNAQSKHAGILRSSALYLIFVVGGCHMIATLSAMGVMAFDLDLSRLPLGLIAIVLAFAVILAMNVIMATMLYRAQARSQAAKLAPPTKAKASKAPAASVAAKKRAEEPGTAGEPLADVPVSAAAMPPCLTMAADEKALQRIQQAFGLSKRETDTLRLAALNQSAKEIADNLFIAQSTVNSHLKSIYRKCDVHSRQELRALVSRFKRDQG